MTFRDDIPAAGFTFIPAEKVAALLIPLDAPVMEIEILRQVFPYSPGSAGRDLLFDIHFSLFNALYRAKNEYGMKNYYLHIDPMRLRMLKTTEGGCGYYHDLTGNFCGEPAGSHGGMCPAHEKIQGGRCRITIDRLREFYLDPENISFGKSDLLNRLMDGTLKFALNMKEIEAAKKFFRLPYPTKKNISARYRELAAQYHPDRNCGREEQMIELNRSYRILREVFIL